MLGFVILSHNNPDQLRKLIDALNRLYDAPPIACHHDFSQSSIDPASFPANTWFVNDSLRTSWGHWSVTGGVLKGLALLYERADPAWFALLSAADYPIASADAVYADLRAGTVDAFLDLRPVRGDAPARHIGTADPDLAQHGDLPLAIRRYMHARVTVPAFASDLVRRRGDPGRGKVDGLQTSYRLPFVSPIGPFDRRYRCYVGSQWFTGTRRAAARLLHPGPRDQAVRRYYQSRWHADESYVNTVLGNQPDLAIDIDPRRFSRWEPGSAHPRAIDERDLAAMLASGKHFARKFVHGSAVVAQLDKALRIG
jgi:hypothetical protein